MLHYLYGHDLGAYPKLRDTMFTHRGDQFFTRLAWPAVEIDENGFEIDQYDGLNPLYVIWEMEDGTHGGSMRLLPTIGQTMINDHFLHLTDGVEIKSPLIWECTRLCISPTADCRVTAALVLAAGELMEAFAIEHLIGVFYSQTGRIFGLNGILPDILGSTGKGKDQIDVGVWEVTQIALQRALKRVGITRKTSKGWFRASFNKTISEQSLVLQQKVRA